MVTLISLPDQDTADRVEFPPGVETVVWDGFADPPARAAEIEYFVGTYFQPPAPRPLSELPGLRVVQLLSAGFDDWLPLLPAGVTLCNGRGVHGASTAELAVAGVSSLLRGLPRAWADQRAHRWAPEPSEGLAGLRVLVVGAGDIGSRIGAAATAFDASAVTLVGRAARAGVAGIANLDALLPESDVVFLAVPLTPQTAHLMDARRLALLPDGAVLANVGRGPTVHTEALLAELTSGRLRAFLDVTDPEPLPADHPLWDAPGVLITPHIGGGRTRWRERGAALIGDQLRRLVAGEPLRNVVAVG